MGTQILAYFVCAVVLRLTLKPLLDKSGATAYLANWKTDWITGLGVSVCVAFGLMLTMLFVGLAFR